MKYGLSYTLITRTTGFLGRTILVYKSTEVNELVSYLKNKNNLRLLDYGCNTGFFLDIVKKKYPQKEFDLYGADINRHALKYARKKYKEFTFYNIDKNLFKKGKFDVIVLAHVLEHVDDREGLLHNLRRLLKDDGELIIVVPQERIRGDCTLFQLLYNIVTFRFENPHKVKIFFNDLKQLLRKQGLRITKHKYVHFLYPFKSNRRRLDSWSLIVRCRRT
ncbi:class I SAM-dependent methyltransferase [Candidatus Woesearchaeota archaeon]|nr:MAG: class I SAM-dependent methyltransferase [Candidatus Woesearchaeota archaeon]